MNTNQSRHAEQEKLVERFNALTREKQGYVLSNLAGQLHKAEQYTQLYELIGKQWMELKFDLTSSHKSFAEDVEIAIGAARSSVPTHWVQLVRNCMVFATLGSSHNESAIRRYQDRFLKAVTLTQELTALEIPDANQLLIKCAHNTGPISSNRNCFSATGVPCQRPHQSTGRQVPDLS